MSSLKKKFLSGSKDSKASKDSKDNTKSKASASSTSPKKGSSLPDYQPASKVLTDKKAIEGLHKVENALKSSSSYKDCKVWVDKNSKTVMISKTKPLSSEPTEDTAGQAIFGSSKFDDDKKWGTLVGLVSEGGFTGSALNASNWNEGW